MDNDDDIGALASSAVAEEKSKKPRKTTAPVASGKKARPRRPKPKPARSPAVPVDDSTPDTVVESETVAPTASKKKTMEQITNQIYRDAAERIVALMDAGNSIWQKPWVAPRGHLCLQEPVNPCLYQLVRDFANGKFLEILVQALDCHDFARRQHPFFGFQGLVVLDVFSTGDRKHSRLRFAADVLPAINFSLDSTGPAFGFILPLEGLAQGPSHPTIDAAVIDGAAVFQRPFLDRTHRNLSRFSTRRRDFCEILGFYRIRKSS